MRVDDGGRRSSGVAADRARERDDPRNVRISELEERLAQLQPPNERVVRTYEQIRTDNNRVYQKHRLANVCAVRRLCRIRVRA
jgi:hypothetical protein